MSHSAAAGWAFEQWNGACSGATCVLTMDSDKTTWATFTSEPDLVVTAVGAPTSGTIGSTIAVSMTVTNQGSGSVGGFAVRFHFSTDMTITVGDPSGPGTLCTFPSGLAAGASDSCSLSITVPGSVSPGDFYVGAIADPGDIQAESDETNNSKAAGNITTISSPQ